MSKCIKTLKKDFEKERKKSMQEMEKVVGKLTRVALMLHSHQVELSTTVDSSESKIISDKHQSRALVQQEYDRAAARESKLRAQIIELEQRTFNLTEATKTVQKKKGIYRRRFLISKRLAAKRLALSIDLKQEKK